MGWFADAYDLSVGAVVGNTQDVTCNSGCVNSGSHLVRTSAVPVPAAAGLFGAGLLGFVGMGRRKMAFNAVLLQGWL